MSALLGSAGTLAGPAPKALEVLTSRGPLQGVSLPDRARAQAAVSGTLNPGVFSAPALELTLPDGQRVVATLQRVVSDDARGTRSWVGTFEDSPGSLVVLSRTKGVVTGFGNYKGQTIELLPSAGGRHVLFTVDGQRLPQGDRVERSTVGGAADLSTPSVSYDAGSTTAAAGAVVHDVLVVYTASAAGASGGATTLESMIQSAIQAANQAYVNSFANITVNMVGLRQVAMTESGSGMYATMSTLETNTEVQDLRKRLGADMVVLVSQDSNYCGYAKLTKYFTNDVVTWWDANSIVYSQCLSNQTVAHELGHLQGLDHNRENTASSGWYPYSYGYRVCASNGFRDIMAYPCSSVNVPIISVFSNPSVTYNGYATGVSYEADPARSAENARTLNGTATTVAGYMVSTSSSTVPASPSSLAVGSTAYNSVGLGWVDNATNESGFKVERSPDGVTFGEIATLGADSRSYTDVTVIANSRYYYRVRAYNGAGASGYSNSVSTTTPGVPPPAPPSPTSVSASDNANGTASVQWVPGSSSATSYSVRRETWNARKRVWTRPVTAATVPAGVTSIIDSPGRGTYRYYVNASNAGGSSAYAGPAPVTVTNGITVKGR